MAKKFAKESFTVMNELVLPNDTNTLNNLMGGKLLLWMDICSAMAAQKHSNSIVVTVSVDNVSFQRSVKLGEVISIEAQVTRSFNSSMEVRMTVYAQNLPEGTKIKTNEAYYTFVAIDSEGRPRAVPETVPETQKEMILFNGALQRRELRLILSGKMKPQDATELQNILTTFGIKN
ncbi:acyl-CoA thioesterase [Sphingobacteriaceae bacterium WQ 2009]|uniref:Acyl-CoA thioesterase n=1 Tax=Rhinopithecimicrobium faecis TaxID=2820698 RepID=A0A8T4HCC2_9SPHI|nr:acyl-CoA thioesterase [Sphingobacteriaceae bacterium WQ 2009]